MQTKLCNNPALGIIHVQNIRYTHMSTNKFIDGLIRQIRITATLLSKMKHYFYAYGLRYFVRLYKIYADLSFK